jgi:hypothetical protein
MKNATESRDSKKVSIKTEEISPINIVTTDKATNPVIKAKDEIKETYNSHMKAQKDFENAFKELSKKDQEAYEEFEKKYQSYEEAIQRAFKLREVAEQDALTVYRRTTEKAGEDYRKAMKSALITCKEATEEARKELLGIARGESGLINSQNTFQGISKAAANSFNVAILKVSRGLTTVKNSLKN